MGPRWRWKKLGNSGRDDVDYPNLSSALQMRAQDCFVGGVGQQVDKLMGGAVAIAIGAFNGTNVGAAASTAGPAPAVPPGKLAVDRDATLVSRVLKSWGIQAPAPAVAPAPALITPVAAVVAAPPAAVAARPALIVAAPSGCTGGRCCGSAASSTTHHCRRCPACRTQLP